MLFPLLSTLKLAVILQQQVPIGSEPTTTLGTVNPNTVIYEEADKSATSVVVNEELVEAVTTKTTASPISYTPNSKGCWRIGEQRSAAANIFQMECCTQFAHLNDQMATQIPDATKCRLRIDFAELLGCTQQADFFLWGHNVQHECLVEILAQIRAGVNTASEFSVVIDAWSGDSLLTSELFNGLRPLEVHSLELFVSATNFSIQMPNLGLFFPHLRQIIIHANVAEKQQKPPMLLGKTFLRDLPMLKSLKIANVDFELNGSEEPQWLEHLERLHLENASFGQLPRWVAKCKRLERIILLNCGLNSTIALSQLASAVQIKMHDNRIHDFHRVSFKCTRLYELDLRRNGILRIATHTLSRCNSLRLLDLSENNFGNLMPDKPFFGCQRLKQLRLERIGLSYLRPEIFIGLSNLKSLSLAGNPLGRIDPFTFLPTRSIRTLSLANCSLDTLPLAVTQCCLLDSLSMDDNRMASRLAMPSEVLALLAHLSHFSFHRNPLLQLPRGLFLYEPINERQEMKLADILNTLIHLPVWRLEPCTPYLWHFHLANASSAELRMRVAAWNVERMRKEGLGHCKQLYETVLEGIAMYRELLENSGCEASRRLRSVRAKENCVAVDKVNGKGRQENAKTSSHTGASIVQFLLAPASVLSPAEKITTTPESTMISIDSTVTMPNVVDSITSTTIITKIINANGTFAHPRHSSLLHLSIGANFFFLAAAILLAAMKMVGWIDMGIQWFSGKRNSQKRSEFEEIY